jgi:hypothetical protein
VAEDRLRSKLSEARLEAVLLRVPLPLACLAFSAPALNPWR